MSITLLYWMIPIILTLHELEEWNILKWYQFHYKNPPSSDNLAVRTWLIFCSVFGFIWTFVSIWMSNDYLTAFFMSLLILVTVQNAIQHIYWQILFRAYSPGVIFSSIGLLLGVYTIYRVTNEGYLTWWVDIVLLIALIPTTIQTIQAKNTMTKFVESVHQFGVWLSNMIWIK